MSLRSVLPTLTVIGLCGLATAVIASPTREFADPETQLPSWETKQHGVALLMSQIPPDAARAFYINRGFSPEQVEAYATSCVFMTVLRNDAAPGALQFTLSEWSVNQNHTQRPPLSTQHWMARWASMGLPKSARIAFRWAQFPPAQEYAVGEWNQGMLTTGLPAGAKFNLTAHWQVANDAYEATLENVRCAQ